MRIEPAPPFRLDQFSKQLLSTPSLLSKAGSFSIEQDKRYLHWDELRRRPVPDGMTHDLWWQFVKFARTPLNHRLPHRANDGRPFTFGMTDTIQRLVHEIDRDASGRIELPEDVTNRTTRDRYIVSSLIEEAFRSSQLEGASTTRQAAKELIRTKREPRTISERMILNNFYAMEWVREHRETVLTAESIFELHSIVTRNTLDVADGAGRFRRADETVYVMDNHSGDVVHTPPGAHLLPSRIKAMCEFANGAVSNEPFIHPVIRAILVHFWIAYDHPFVDGNGRTARALFYWTMLKQGYWLTEFISISRAIRNARAQYDRAFIYTETDANDTIYFILNQLKMLRTAIDDLFTYLRRKAQEVRDLEQQLRVRDDLNNRQLALLGHALRHPGERLTIEAHQTANRVVYQTARTDLLGLVQRGFLEQGKAGKKLYFTPVRDLSRRLSSSK